MIHISVLSGVASELLDCEPEHLHATARRIRTSLAQCWLTSGKLDRWWGFSNWHLQDYLLFFQYVIVQGPRPWVMHCKYRHILWFLELLLWKYQAILNGCVRIFDLHTDADTNTMCPHIPVSMNCNQWKDMKKTSWLAVHQENVLVWTHSHGFKRDYEPRRSTACRAITGSNIVETTCGAHGKY